MPRQAFTPPDDDDDVFAALTSGPTPRARTASTVPDSPARTNGAARASTTPSPLEAPHRARGAVADQPVKRIGLYLNKSRWLWLKSLSVRRAEAGLPADFTSIFLEALEEKYRQ